MISNDSTASLSITVKYLFYLGRDIIGCALDTSLPCFHLKLIDMVNLKCFSEKNELLDLHLFSVHWSETANFWTLLITFNQEY